jgi:hypothetical protein
LYNQYPERRGQRKIVAPEKGVNAEVGPGCAGTGLGGQNKICPTVAVAESYLYYKMIIVAT